MSFFEAIQEFLNPEHLNEEELVRETKERTLRNYDKEEYELKTVVEDDKIIEEKLSKTSSEDGRTNEEELSETNSQYNASDTSSQSSDDSSEMSDMEGYIQEIEESMGTISLSGKELMKDLQDTLETELEELGQESINIDKFSEKLTERFMKTVSVATTGLGYDELESEDKPTLTEKEKEDITNSIKQATTKLAEELNKEKEGYYLWKSTNSLTAANKERSFLNIVGQMYDCIGYVCHTISVKLGFKDKTAAELFAEVANNAKEIHEKFSSAQIERDEKYKNAGKYYGFNRKNMERNEDSLKEAVAAKDQETMNKTIEELGKLLKDTYKSPKELNEAISKIDLVDKHVGKNTEKLLKEREAKESELNKRR